jgi:excisionase family DNA binding protein
MEATLEPRHLDLLDSSVESSVRGTIAAPLLDMSAVADLLSTSERHVRRLVAERRIPFVRVGRFIRFEASAISAWVEAHSTDAAS